MIRVIFPIIMLGVTISISILFALAGTALLGAIYRKTTLIHTH